MKLIKKDNKLQEDFQTEMNDEYEIYKNRARQLKRIKSRDEVHFNYTGESNKRLDRRKDF